MPSYWGNCSPWSPPCGVDGPVVPVVPGPANESDETPGCQTKSQLDEYFHLSPHQVIIKWWKFNLHSIKYGKNGAALLWVAIYVCFHVLCLCGLLLCRLGQVPTFTFRLWPDFTHLIFSCVLGVHKKPPRAAWTRPLPVRLHHPPSTSICKLRFILNLCYLFATHTRTPAHSHTLWPFNALAKLKLTANVTFYDCVCISTVCVCVYVRGVCACVCFEGFRAAFAPGSTLEMLECLSGFSLSQHYANAALLPISICLFMNCY